LFVYTDRANALNASMAHTQKHLLTNFSEKPLTCFSKEVRSASASNLSAAWPVEAGETIGPARARGSFSPKVRMSMKSPYHRQLTTACWPTMIFDSLEKHDCVGCGNKSIVYKVSPTIVVKKARQNSDENHAFLREIEFYRCLAKRQDRCPDIVECFLALPDHLFLFYCDLNRVDLRYSEHQEREKCADGFPGRLIRVNHNESSALIARWIQQITSALEYVEKMGFCHNDLHPRNCLLDQNLHLRLCDFDRATTVGKFLEGVYAPWARELVAGPLKGSYGLCCARTEQFAVGSLLYFLVYGHEPYEDLDLANQNPGELSRRFGRMEFPELNRCGVDVFNEFISACWHNVYPTMTLAAYDIKRKTKYVALDAAETEIVDCAKEGKACETLIRQGLLGPDLASRFQPAWRRYLLVIAAKFTSIWRSLINLLRRS
jgi:serine/threonine protein kinase